MTALAIGMIGLGALLLWAGIGNVSLWETITGVFTQ